MQTSRSCPEPVREAADRVEASLFDVEVLAQRFALGDAPVDRFDVVQRVREEAVVFEVVVFVDWGAVK
jgi:hypothetical protein